jgi:hypothetical protein
MDGKQTRGDTAHEAAYTRLPARPLPMQIHFLHIREIHDETASSSAAIIIRVFKIRTFGSYILAHGSIKTSLYLLLAPSLSLSYFFVQKHYTGFFNFLEPMMSRNTRQLALHGTGNPPVHSIYHVGNPYLCAFVQFVTWASLISWTIVLCMQCAFRERYHVKSATLVFLVFVSCTYALQQLCAYDYHCRWVDAACFLM